jgi:hypothetical protein
MPRTIEGEPLYPLGEFDPLFIRDLTKFSVEQELNAAEGSSPEGGGTEGRTSQSAGTPSWNEKLDQG